MVGSSLSSLDPRLFVLFSLLSGIRGDCGAPPKLKNAIPTTEVDGKSFAPLQSVTYKCLEGFYNIHAKPDVVTCLPDSQWTDIEEFCERSCTRPPRSGFARRKSRNFQIYYPAKSEVTYICLPGYNSIPGINPVVTCLENYTWTAVPSFCEGKTCGDPGKPENGEVVGTNFLYLAKIHFTCKDGFRLIGSPSIQCILKETDVEWEPEPPKCQQITCFSPPHVTNASHDGGSTGNFTYNSTVTYKCDRGFSLTGEASIRCTTEDSISGVWRGSSPECKEITCFSPPHVTNASHDGERAGTYTYNSRVTYKCDRGFSLTGEASIRCTTDDNISGIWRGPAPECREATTMFTTTMPLTKRPMKKGANPSGRGPFQLWPPNYGMISVMRLAWCQCCYLFGARATAWSPSWYHTCSYGCCFCSCWRRRRCCCCFNAKGKKLIHFESRTPNVRIFAKYSQDK